MFGVLLLAAVGAPDRALASAGSLVQVPASWFGANVRSFEASCEAKGGRVVREGSTRSVCEVNGMKLLTSTAKPGSSRIVSATVAKMKDGVSEHEALAGILDKYGKPTWMGHIDEFGPCYRWDLGGKRIEFYMGRANNTFRIVVLEKER